MRDGFHGTVSNKVEGPTARQSGMVMVGRSIESADTSSIFAAVLCLFLKRKTFGALDALLRRMSRLSGE
jgi:hypothetical protein